MVFLHCSIDVINVLFDVIEAIEVNVRCFLNVIEANDVMDLNRMLFDVIEVNEIIKIIDVI